MNEELVADPPSCIVVADVIVVERGMVDEIGCPMRNEKLVLEEGSWGRVGFDGLESISVVEMGIRAGLLLSDGHIISLNSLAGGSS